MKKTIIRYPGLISVLALWLGLSLFAWLKPADQSSDTERRLLEQFPAVTAKSVFSGDFSRAFASYAVDQFPLRETFRRTNAIFNSEILRKKDNNGIYLHDGYAAKMEYPLDLHSISYASERFEDLYDRYLAKTDCRIRFVMVPDKNYYLGESAGALKMDYDQLFAAMQDHIPWAEFVDITDMLSQECYYHTDTHWSQDRILPAAGKIIHSFDAVLPENFHVNALERDFYGVYYGQAALPMYPDTLHYLTWDGWEDWEVFSVDTGKTTKIYDAEKYSSRDLYDVFLSGGMAIQTVTNPHPQNDRELVVFRDSFGSSLVPLFAQSYAKITLLDTRYISPAMLGDYVEFSNQDVLFLYSTLILNSSSALKK